MTLFLSKLLPVFVYPLGLAMVLGAIVLTLLLAGLRRTAASALVVALAVLYVASMPVVADWMYATLESQYPARQVATLPQADVAIVLGGAIGPALPPRVAVDLTEASDRVFHAAHLFLAGKVGHVVVSGGNLPWLTSAVPEADSMAALLVELGVPRSAIVLESKSRNTHENAVNCAAILDANGWRIVLLVTSSVHMPRALAAFRRSGIDAVPATTDVRVVGSVRTTSPLDVLPDAAALARTTEAIKEWLGLVAYRIRGWA